MTKLSSFPDTRRMIHALAIVALATLFAAGCGDGGQPDTDTGSDTTAQDVIITTDVNQDVPSDTNQPDNVEPVDALEETGVDVPAEIPDDNDPPYVVATYPANEETDIPVPFVIRVTFNEDIRFEVTVSSNTFKLFDIHDNEIPGALAYDATTFTVSFTPDGGTSILALSPYRVWLSEMIQDRAGNRMEEFEFKFATSGPEQMDSYLPVAAKYAPAIYQSTTQGSAQWDYPTLFDMDGDWTAGNNVDALNAATLVPVWVYYDVVETYTHYFIRYHYFYPKHQDTSKTYGNEVAGVMVVVQKNPEEPVAVETYFGTGAFEDIRSFVTVESGLVKDDDSDGDYVEHRRNYNVNWVFPKDQLFPGGHFQSYVTTKSHESCAWTQTNKEETLDFKCALTVADKPGLKIMHFAYTDGNPGILGPTFPYSNAEGNEVGYGLRLLINDWWVRRDSTGVGGMFSSTLEFVPPEGLAGSGLVMPGSFKGSPDPGQAGGKTPWRWTWEPAVASAYNYYVEFPEGTFFVHPAYYFARRHRVTLTTDTTGVSGAYCYNPYIFVDQRGQSADCLPLD